MQKGSVCIYIRMYGQATNTRATIQMNYIKYQPFNLRTKYNNYNNN